MNSSQSSKSSPVVRSVVLWALSRKSPGFSTRPRLSASNSKSIVSEVSLGTTARLLDRGLEGAREAAVLLLGAAILLVPLFALVRSANLPTVYTSYRTGQCVKVETLYGPGDCRALPEYYHHVWSK